MFSTLVVSNCKLKHIKNANAHTLTLSKSKFQEKTGRPSTYEKKKQQQQQQIAMLNKLKNEKST